MYGAESSDLLERVGASKNILREPEPLNLFRGSRYFFFIKNESQEPSLFLEGARVDEKGYRLPNTAS
jgi:hypothetical protein